jgi:predicted O-methyltransferase YrrM
MLLSPPPVPSADPSWDAYQSARIKPAVNISDAFVGWLCYANPGMLNRGNLHCFDHAIKNLPSNDPLLEIGSFCGLSTNLLTYYKQLNGKRNRLITCDRWMVERKSETLGKTDIPHGEYREFIKASYIRNIQFFARHDLPWTIELLSDEFFAAWDAREASSDVLGRPITLGGKFSFCYIDGAHTYEQSKRDFVHCDAHLVPGGFVLFDDSADGTEWDVCRVVKEVAQRGDYELVMKNPNYLFRKK